MSMGRSKYLTHASKVGCKHGGVLMFSPPTRRSMTVNGNPILCKSDVLRASIVNCTQVGQGRVPCTKVVRIVRGVAKAIDIDGETPVLDSLQARTNGSPIQELEVTSVGDSNAMVAQEAQAHSADEPLSEDWTVSSLRWSRDEAREGDSIALLANTSNLADGTPVQITIFEYDADGRHDRVRVLFGEVENQSIRLEWEYHYQDDVDDIPTQEEAERYGGKYNPPEYFFVIEVFGKTFGHGQESKLLRFRDWIEIRLSCFGTDEPFPNEEFVIRFADNSKQQRRLDSRGFARIDGVPPGRCVVSFPNLKDY